MFRSLKAEEDFVDVTLSCESQQYSAHKVVLSACSPYFRKLLKVSQSESEFSSQDCPLRLGTYFRKPLKVSWSESEPGSQGCPTEFFIFTLSFSNLSPSVTGRNRTGSICNIPSSYRSLLTSFTKYTKNQPNQTVAAHFSVPLYALHVIPSPWGAHPPPAILTLGRSKGKSTTVLPSQIRDGNSSHFTKARKAQDIKDLRYTSSHPHSLSQCPRTRVVNHCTERHLS